MRNSIPTYLTRKDNVIWTVCGTAFFAELFILIYQPFGSGSWTDHPFVYIGLATAVVLVAMGIIAISRTIMYKYAKHHPVLYWHYVIWIISEVIAMSIVYSLAAVIIKNDYANYFDFFKEALLYTVFVLFIPYAICMMVFALIDKDAQINTLKAELAALQGIPGLEEDEDHPQVPVTYNFKDERGELKLSVQASSVYFVESSDNYVIIYYQNGNRLPHYVLRNTLKNIDDEFGQSGLVRCHRSYMVNFSAIKVLSKTDDGLMIDFGTDKLPKIPVSKTYSARFLEKFK